MEIGTILQPNELTNDRSIHLRDIGQFHIRNWRHDGRVDFGSIEQMDVSDAQIVDGGALGIGRVNVELDAIVEFYIAFDIHGKGGPGQNLNLNAIFQLELAINDNGYIAADLDDCVVAPF